MENTTDIAQTIINTINTIFENLFASIDNNLYSLLDEITFINSDIIKDKTFEKIFGTSASDGILIIANSLLLGFIVYYSIRYLMSHLTFHRIENPFAFIIKLIIFGIFMNFSFSVLSIFLDLFDNISSSIRYLGENLFNHSINFSQLITKINSTISINSNSIDIFSINGIIKSTLTLSLVNLVFSYSFRYIMIKIFVLLAPFAFLSLTLDSSSWFFKTWFKNLFSLLFIQIIVSLVLLILFSFDFSNSNLFTEFIYVGGIYALIKTNTIVREFIGGISTNISQTVQNFSNLKL